MKPSQLLRFSLMILSLLALWQGIILIFHLPAYILPSPDKVALCLYENAALITQESLTTITETLLGLLLGIVFGCWAALCLILFRPLSFWLLPLVILSQALPIFAIAPLFVIWFGYGMFSKIVITMLMLFFPVTSAFYDGLRQTNPDWLDLAKTMNSSKWRLFWRIRMPAALPNLASGLRMAAAIAPIGAILGEWVGSSHGLGYLMLNANARMQIDFMFATIFILSIFALLLYFGVDYLLKTLIHWQRVEA